MNTLGYAILSALGRKPCSGYQLATYLDVLWPAKHSQIYPLLTKMEKKDLVVFEHIEQTGKPDKKLFSITEKGRETLEKWITETPVDSTIKDEFLIKIYSIWLTEEEHAKKLIQDRISILEQKVALETQVIAKMEKEYEMKKSHTMSRQFGHYLLFKRNNLLNKEEISWCNWVLNVIEKISLSEMT